MDIKETKELLIGINEISIYLIGVLKDGVDLADFTGLWDKIKEDAEFAEKLKAAWQGVKAIPEEIKDIDLMEGVDLVQLQVSYVPAIIKAVAK